MQNALNEPSGSPGLAGQFWRSLGFPGHHRQQWTVNSHVGHRFPILPQKDKGQRQYPHLRVRSLGSARFLLRLSDPRPFRPTAPAQTPPGLCTKRAETGLAEPPWPGLHFQARNFIEVPGETGSAFRDKEQRPAEAWTANDFLLQTSYLRSLPGPQSSFWSEACDHSCVHLHVLALN